MYALRTDYMNFYNLYGLIFLLILSNTIVRMSLHAVVPQS